MENSKELKQLYLNTEINQQKDLDKIKLALSDLKDNQPHLVDKLLDTINYTNATYSVLKMQYLILYITYYLNEKKIIQNDSIPINTSLKILLSQDWISDKTKDFLKAHYEKALKDKVDYSQYLISLDTYLDNLAVFR